LGKVVKRVRGLKRYHYGHAGKYAHKVYQTKQKDRDQSTMYHEQSSRRIKSEVSQDSINLLSLISTLESISSRTLQTYTVGEKLTLIKQIQEALKVATSKGLTTEACELYRIFNESKFDELRNLVGSNSYNKQIAEMIVDSFAKHTRLAVTPYEELMTHAIAKVDGKTLTSEGVMAKYSKTCEAKKFIDDVYAGKYGKMYQGNNAFRTYLINKYNHYLDSSKGVESLTHYITNKLEREDRKHNSLYTPLSGKLISIVEGGKMVDGESYPVIIGRDDRVDSAIISYLDSQKITDDRTR